MSIRNLLRKLGISTKPTKEEIFEENRQLMQLIQDRSRLLRSPYERWDMKDELI